MEQEKANLDTLDATNAKKDQIDERSYANNCTLKVKNQELNTFFIIFATEFLFALFIDTNIDLIKIEFGDNYMLAFTIIISIKGLMSLISAILCGNLSDKFGRKPLIMFTMFMSFLPHLLILKSCYLAYFICLTLGGIFNDHMNLLVTFGADISSKRNRDKIFSILISASFFANAFASIIGEYLISVKDNGTLDFRYVVATSFIILVFVQIYIFFTLDSSKSGGQSIPNKNYRIDGSNNEPEVEGNGIVGKISRYMHQENVKKVVILVSISTFVIEGLLFTNLLYLRYIVTFSERDLAKYMLFSLLTYGIHSFICPRILIDKLGYRNAIMLCIIFQIISTNVNGIFSNEIILFSNVFLIAYSLMLFIIALAYTSKKVEDSDQGIFIGFFAGIKHLMGMMSPPLTALLFKAFKQHKIIGGNHIKHLDSYINSQKLAPDDFGYYVDGLGRIFTGLPYMILSLLLVIPLFMATKLEDDAIELDADAAITVGV